MLVDSRPELEEAMDGMVSDIMERFAGMDESERLQSVKAVLLGVSAVAGSKGLAADNPSALSMLFDYRCRSGGVFSDAEGMAEVLASEDVARLPEEDQRMAGHILDAIAL